MSEENTQPPSPRFFTQQERYLHPSGQRAGQTQSERSVPQTQVTPPLSPVANVDDPRHEILQNLRDNETSRHGRIAEYNTDADPSPFSNPSDTETPLFDDWYDYGGSDAIRTLTGFSGSEYLELWETLKPRLNAIFSVGRGRRSTKKPADILLLTFHFLKTGSDYGTCAQTFKMKASNFERLVVKCIMNLSTYAYDQFVVALEEKYSMHEMDRIGSRFQHFKSARYATDVVFQQSNRPSGNLAEGRAYFSGKHKLYGFKTEVSVLPNVLAISSSKHYPASTSDLRIFQERQNVHKELLKKNASIDEHDNDPYKRTYPDLWALLADKGYQGAIEFIRCILPKKKPRNRELSVSEETYNRRVGTDRVIVENFFGRLISCWGIMDRKWVRREELYDHVLYLCISLTNFHIQRRPLRRADMERFNQGRNRLFAIAASRFQDGRGAGGGNSGSRSSRRNENSRRAEADALN